MLAISLVGLTACATRSATDGTAPAPQPTPTSSESATSAQPTPTPSASPAPDAAWPTSETISCDAMLSPDIDATLRARGLSPAPKEWTQFGFQATGAALECPWGQPGSTVSDAFYAWARFEPGQADQFIASVLANDYRIEQSERGSWVITPPDLASGGTIAILATPEWVAFAPTRDQIDDIVWAR